MHLTEPQERLRPSGFHPYAVGGKSRYIWSRQGAPQVVPPPSMAGIIEERRSAMEAQQDFDPYRFQP